MHAWPTGVSLDELDTTRRLPSTWTDWKQTPPQTRLASEDGVVDDLERRLRE